MIEPTFTLILASASPRRAAILESLGIPFEARPADVEEVVLSGESPVEHALRLSRMKADAVAAEFPTSWVLGGDTVVTIDGQILGKPSDRADAERMLLHLQGRTHEVISALTLVIPEGDAAGRSVLSDAEVTAVTFRPFGLDIAQAYAETDEPFDKAGGYGIQERGAALVERVDGDYSAVVGLPVPLLMRFFEQAGRPYRFGG